LERRSAFSHLKSQISDLKVRCESISKQLFGWIESLKKGEVKGQRYLTPWLRDKYQRDKDAQVFPE